MIEENINIKILRKKRCEDRKKIVKLKDKEGIYTKKTERRLQTTEFLEQYNSQSAEEDMTQIRERKVINEESEIFRKITIEEVK